MLPPELRSAPLIVYMHENQAAYPFRTVGDGDEERDHQLH